MALQPCRNAGEGCWRDHLHSCLPCSRLQSGDLRNARALAYDMVYNGVEIGGGSLRIYRRDIQAQVGGWVGTSLHVVAAYQGYLCPLHQSSTAQLPQPWVQVFATIGLSEEEARAKFGYLLDAFEIGAPPHGGERVCAGAQLACCCGSAGAGQMHAGAVCLAALLPPTSRA